MVTVAQSLPSHKSNRRAFGGHRQASPQQRTQYVAESTALRQDEGRAWTWADYGLLDNPTQQVPLRCAITVSSRFGVLCGVSCVWRQVCSGRGASAGTGGSGPGVPRIG